MHSRRQEAELRLKGAEENLLRLDDVLTQIGAQAESLRRQARQAARYRALAAEIRRHEALIALISFAEASREADEAQHAFETNVVDVAERTRQQAEAARLQALAAHRMPFLRDAEAQAAAALQRLVLARDALEGEEKRATERKAETERRIAHAAGDLARERAHYEDAAATLARLEAEDEELDGAGEAEADLVEEARLRCEAAEEKLRARSKRWKSPRTPSPTPRPSAMRWLKPRGARNRLLGASRPSFRAPRTKFQRCATAPKATPNWPRRWPKRNG